jgi:hypothetical protein
VVIGIRIVRSMLVGRDNVYSHIPCKRCRKLVDSTSAGRCCTVIVKSVEAERKGEGEHRAYTYAYTYNTGHE